MKLRHWYMLCFTVKVILLTLVQWFSSGTTFSEYADGGHYKMSKMDKRENIIMVSLVHAQASSPSIDCDVM